MTVRVACLGPLVVALSALMPVQRAAAWPMDPSVNVPLCTAAGNQHQTVAVPDNAGGVIVTWVDYRSGTGNPVVYTHHVMADGVVDPEWPVDGLVVCAAGAAQVEAAAVSDGLGGVIVTWTDYRSGTSNPDIYAQHVLASGAIDSAWPTNGRALCTAAFWQRVPGIVTDGYGGAIVAWQDNRSGIHQGDSDIYAQHILAGGMIDPAWPIDGRALCTAPNSQGAPLLVSDGAGGAVAIWEDGRSGVGEDRPGIYAQHVMASGIVDLAWPPNGVALCTAAGWQFELRSVADGLGGAIVAWTDSRNGYAYDLYVQHVLASGLVDASWPLDGLPLCTAAGTQRAADIVSDGAGGAVVVWLDRRGVHDSDIYGQHVQASGVIDPAWPADGLALCVVPDSQIGPSAVMDGHGGAIVAWCDSTPSTSKVHAQRILASGVVDPSWPANGRALCTATGAKYEVRLVADGLGGATAAWSDTRNGSGNLDIYAQHVLANGQLGDGAVGVGDEVLPGLVLEQSPNPTRGLALKVRFALPNSEPAVVELFDIAGRLLVTQEVGSLGPGRHAIGLATGMRLQGFYVLRLRQGASTRTSKIAILN